MPSITLGMSKILKAQIPPAELPDWLTESTAAHLLSTSTDTLRRWHREGTGPRRVRLATRTVRYRRSEVEAWAKERARA